ncbi:MAG: MoxR family ATPase, partial [Planctomycetota bacterium]
FMFEILISYPKKEEEIKIVKSTTAGTETPVKPVLSAADILNIQDIIRRIPVSDHVVTYATDIVRATRPKESESPDFVKEWVAWGAGPRAAQYLVLGAKAKAAINGRYNVSVNDVKSMCHPVLRHRIFTNFNADSEGIDADSIVDKLLKTIQEPQYK